ncbi:hypothetical protein CSO01_15320 [Cellulomonas soli]|uniref:Ribbon-helix-helix protein CopG domain-containing protein n=1 Tax=Cellulomonas soli TaxID=931535 RepID=A0A512PC93_9CELL|nr:hypothetical protein CSO01_15320 [Cellulomonas soli]
MSAQEGSRRGRYFVYVISVSDERVVYGTIHGAEVDDAQVRTWAEEAEAGYDLPALRRRRRGRPALGDGPGRAVTVRLDEGTLAALNARAQAEGFTSQSEAIRAAVRAWSHVA